MDDFYLSGMEDKIKKWRLILGNPADPEKMVDLGDSELGVDAVLNALYDSERKGGLGSSSPNVNRWLGDIRKYFPYSMVEVMQRDALERLKLDKILKEPELVDKLEKNVHLASLIISLARVLPNETKETARLVVRQIADEILKKFQQPLRQAMEGAVRRKGRNIKPRPNEIDWHETIRKNLKNYQPDYATIIPQYLRGFNRKKPSMKHIVLLVDQSGSMASSVVYAGIFGSVIASLPALQTSFVVFDTEVIDLTEDLHDPVELLFGVQLGGGTDINKALGFVSQMIENPAETTIFLITDLYEGGNGEEMIAKARTIMQAGTQLIVLLALNDEGAPSFDRAVASKLAQMNIPAFGCSPHKFPDLFAAALEKRDLTVWST